MAKVLLYHVLDGTYRADRHAKLLTSPLPATCPFESDNADVAFLWRQLRKLIFDYRNAQRLQARDRIAHEFGRVLAELHEAYERTGLSVPERVYAGLGPSGREMTSMGVEGATAQRALYEAFEQWEAEHGYRWRVLHDCPTPADRMRLPDEPVDLIDEGIPNPPMWDEFRALNARAAA